MKADLRYSDINRRGFMRKHHIAVFFISLIFSVLSLAMLSKQAYAEPREIVECGPALETDMDTEPAYNYCDIYSRQREYKKTNADYRKQLEKRRKDYNVPRELALKGYHDWQASRYEQKEKSKDRSQGKTASKALKKKEISQEERQEQKKTESLNAQQLSKIHKNSQY